MRITTVKALEILDSRGKPTIRAFVILEDGSSYAASVPSGASTGAHEAVELRDGDKTRHLGAGVLTAVNNVNTSIASAIAGMDISDQRAIDTKMIDLDGTSNKSRLGANAILAVSMAVAKAAAKTANKPLWSYLHDVFFMKQTPAFPRLMVNVVNGGKHAGWNFDIQEFMIVPQTTIPHESTRIAAEIFQQLIKNIKKVGMSTLVGDEGGLSPAALKSNEEVLAAIFQAAEDRGYLPQKDFTIALDAAATEFYQNETYVLKKTNEVKTATQMIQYYAELAAKYYIESFEDPFAEDDWTAFQQFTAIATQKKFQVVGDDLYVTNTKRIARGITEKSTNAVLIKLNQIGTVSETADAINMTFDAGWKNAISHRSGETEDSFIADLAYASGAQFIKTGSMSRSDRLSKYNRLLEIEKGF